MSLSPRLLLSPPLSRGYLFFFFCYFLFFRKSRFFFIFLGRFAHFILTLRSALMYLVTLLFIVFDFFLWNSREGFYLFKRKKENLILKVGRIEFTHASSAFTNDHPPTHSYNRLSYVGILSSLYYTIPATQKKQKSPLALYHL